VNIKTFRYKKESSSYDYPPDKQEKMLCECGNDKFYALYLAPYEAVVECEKCGNRYISHDG
jgi:uncharacterized protein (DUF983 family)